MGVSFQYKVQVNPDGLAQAFLLGEEFISDAPSALILGDNIFYGHDLHELLQSADQRENGATVFAYHVHDPERYGVAEFDDNNQVISLDEKPDKPKSETNLKTQTAKRRMNQKQETRGGTQKEPRENQRRQGTHKQIKPETTKESTKKEKRKGRNRGWEKRRKLELISGGKRSTQTTQ